MEHDESSGSMLVQYHVLEALGTGGMKRFYKAFHPRLQRYVAFKVILPESAARPGFRERFEQEAQLIARLHHPHIVGKLLSSSRDGETDWDVVGREQALVHRLASGWKGLLSSGGRALYC